MPSLQDSLLRWYAAKGRDLPWRKTRDPYAILVSEVMLQQTQVDRVVSKYEAWLARYPDWKRLAAASRADVLKVWSGLGYNNRALRLHALAKTLVEQHGSKLPETEEELRKLPGIGPYTAGAITVFSYNRPGLCIDVNIERIVKRAFFTRRQHLTKEQLATTFLRSFPKGRATDWGNALMDLGSVVCTPSTPNCAACPLSHGCRSRGERPEERSERERKRQSPFLGSNRWWRGRLLNVLAVEDGLSEAALYRKVEKQGRAGDGKKDGKLAFRSALAELKAEGVLHGTRKVSIKE